MTPQARAAIKTAAKKRVDEMFATGWRPSQEQIDKLAILLRPESRQRKDHS